MPAKSKKPAAKKTTKKAPKTTKCAKTGGKKATLKTEERVKLLKSIHKQLLALNREVPCGSDTAYRSLKTLKCIEPKPCAAGKSFRARTKRCVNAEPCKNGLLRDAVTFRCRKPRVSNDFNYDGFISANRGKKACPKGQYRVSRGEPCEDLLPCETFTTKRKGKDGVVREVVRRRSRYIPTNRCRVKPSCKKGTHFDPYSFTCI